MVKLNLGCGDKILEGYVNIDTVSSRAGKQPDVNADMCDLSKIKSFAADEYSPYILSSIFTIGK